MACTRRTCSISVDRQEGAAHVPPHAAAARTARGRQEKEERAAKRGAAKKEKEERAAKRAAKRAAAREERAAEWAAKQAAAKKEKEERAAEWAAKWAAIMQRKAERAQRKVEAEAKRAQRKEREMARRARVARSAADYSKLRRDNFKQELSTASGGELERLKQIKAHRAAQAKLRYRNFVERRNEPRKKMRVAA